jgi:acetaldehyde dehydrogenase/alcohol dehydrogenase
MRISSHVQFQHCLLSETLVQGTVLVHQGQTLSKCCILLEGQLGAVLRDTELERSVELPIEFKQGQLIFAEEFLSSTESKCDVIASTDCKLLVLDRNSFEAMQEEPEQLKEFYSLAMTSVLQQNQAMAELAQNNLMSKASIPEVDFMVERSVIAYKELQTLPEEKIDEVILAVAQAVNDQAQRFALDTVQESSMGVAEHKQLKIQLGTIEVANSLLGKPGLGQSFSVNESMKLNGSEINQENVQEMAQSMGVVFAMIPVTNPVETLTFKFLSALKSRNSVIMSSHRKAQNVGKACVLLIQKILKQHGLDENIIQTPQMPPNRAITNAFMTHKKVNFILATGGPSMVHSAYCSGTPAIGVGKGNAPVWISADANVSDAAINVVASKSFDNGIVCGSENNLLLDEKISAEFFERAIEQGAAVLDEEEVSRLLTEVFSSGALDARWVGQSAADIAEFAQIYRPYEIKLLLASVLGGDLASPLLKEKLAPVLSVSIMGSDDQALSLAKTILQNEGAGHTAIVYSQDILKIKNYASMVDVSRVLVNTPGTQGCIGAANGLKLSWTLGCGTQGGGSTSDNVTYEHLMNVKRIAYNT